MKVFMKNIITFIFTLKIFDFEDFYVRYNFKQKEKFVRKKPSAIFGKDGSKGFSISNYGFYFSSFIKISFAQFNALNTLGTPIYGKAWASAQTISSAVFPTLIAPQI